MNLATYPDWISDKNLTAKNGKTITTADLGSEYGFKDVDGKS